MLSLLLLIHMFGHFIWAFRSYGVDVICIIVCNATHCSFPFGGGCQWNFRKRACFIGWKRPRRPACIGWDPKISPIEMPVFYHFSAGKTKSTDFFDTKYGGFAPKVRMFAQEKSDVSDLSKCGFCRFFHVLCPFPGCSGTFKGGVMLKMFGKSFQNPRIWTLDNRKTRQKRNEVLSKFFKGCSIN